MIFKASVNKKKVLLNHPFLLLTCYIHKTTAENGLYNATF